MLTPSEKCSVLLARNIATAGPSPAGPKASTASGKPMLPQLLNITGGTKVRGSYLNSRAIGQPTAAETAITMTAPSISQP